MAGNTGTKQIRVGRVHRFIDGLEVRQKALEDTRLQAGGQIDEGLLVRSDELKKVIAMLKKEFDYES